MSNGSTSRLQDAAKPFCERIKTICGGESNDISVITHIDADGITSGSILLTALSRLGCRCSVRAEPEISESLIHELTLEKKDLCIFTDLGNGWASKIRSRLGNDWIIVDHHQLPEEEVLTDDSNQIFNAWRYGIDGGMGISAGGMAYMLAIGLDAKNRDLSSLAVVSAVADRQDQGEKKSLVSVNSEILSTAESLGLVTKELDIAVAGRETRPIHEALAFTSAPYIQNLTWNSDKCHAILSAAGLRLKHEGRWRVFSEITQEEKGIVIDAIAKFVSLETTDSKNVVDDFVGYVYTLESEDRRSPLRDIREFSTLLNACGRTGQTGIGISVCAGDRNKALYEAEHVVRTYRNALRSYISALTGDKSRIIDENAGLLFVRAEGVVPEQMLGAVSSLLSSSPSFSSRLIFVRTQAEDAKSYKFSCRRGMTSISKVNLGLLMRESSSKVKGTGGGHSAAAGCRIPSDSLHEFLLFLKNGAVEEDRFAAVT